MKVRVLIQRALFSFFNTGLPCQRARAIQDSASAGRGFERVRGGYAKLPLGRGRARFLPRPS